MRYIIFSILCLSFFLGTIALIAFYSSKPIAYSPPEISCRIDDDCTQCFDARSIVYGQCVNTSCVYGAPRACPSAGPKWSAQCINNGVAYCFSAP